MKNPTCVLTNDNPKLPEREWTIEIGSVSMESLVTQMERRDINVGIRAKAVMKNRACTILREKKTLTIERCEVRKFGFTKRPTTTELWNTLENLGGICPAEVGPHLRLYYTQQSVGAHVWVVMNPVADEEGYSGAIFIFGCQNGKLWFGIDRVDPNHYWDLKREIVYVKRKS